MDFSKIKSIYFIGIGGIGMSALARYFNAIGKLVSGYDKTETELTKQLSEEGIKVHFEDDISFFKQTCSQSQEEVLIIYTPAIPSNHKELNYFRSHQFNLKKRSEVLGLITENTFSLAVAGTHGKTTTSTILAHILKSAGKDCSAFLGGISKNYHSNYLISENKNKEGPTVVEADEFDRSFLTLHPSISIITSVDADHLDIYDKHEFLKESFELFAKQTKDNGCIISKLGLDFRLPESDQIKKYSYAISAKADFFASNIRIENGTYHFDLHSIVEPIPDLNFSFPGMHNLENAIAAMAAAQIYGVTAAEIKKAMQNFWGVKRRFDCIFKNENLVYIDDYAHHPEELKACINSVKLLYPGKKITGIFQPHLYSRTRDFADDFAKSLDLLDACILLEIYPARELPIEGVSSAMLLEKMKNKNKMLCSKEDLMDELESRNIQILLTLGAGDIDKLVTDIEGRLKAKSF